MYKNYTRKLRMSQGHILKIWLIMRLTIVILIASLIQVSAASFGQKITLSAKNATLNQVFNKIKAQSGIDFLVSSEILKNAKKVSIEVKEKELSIVLGELFKGQLLEYTIEDKFVVVSKKEQTFTDKINDLLTARQTLTGQVTDSAGANLVGATITAVKIGMGAKEGIGMRTTSDGNGNFRLSVAPGEYRLAVSYIGYVPYQKNITIGIDDVDLKIVLSVFNNQLAEVAVVNTGYQQLKVEQATGSYNILSKEQIEKPSLDISSRLIGTTAGLQATPTAAGGLRFEIRGKSDLRTSNSSPLFVVDGFPVTNALQGPTATIDPNNVESITILKDAAAASIWGAKAVNGVVVITTKTAKKGIPLKIEFSAFTRVAPKFDLNYARGLASSSETVDYERLVYNKYGAAPTNNTTAGVVKRSDASIALNENLLGNITSTQLEATLAQLKTQDNSQQIADNLLSKQTYNQYNLSLSGASQKMSNVLSLGFQKGQYNFKNNKDEQYNFNYRSTVNLFKWLDLSFGATAEYVNTEASGIFLADIKGWSPYSMLMNPDGTLTNVPQYYTPILNRVYNVANFKYPFSYNPIQEMNNRDVLTPEFNTRFQTGLTAKLLKGLTYDLKGQYEYFTRTNYDYEGEETFLVRNLINTTSTVATNGTVTANLPLGAIIQNQQRNTTNRYYIRNQLNFNRTLGSAHEINFIAGTEFSKLITQVFANPTTYGYNDNTLTVGTPTLTPTVGWQGGTNRFATNNSYSYGTQVFYSLFANAAYTYLGKYTFSASFRTDASNLIADDPKYRYRPFGSLGVSYDITKEKFLNKVDWLDRLNFRATYGYNGNVDASTSPYTLIALNAAANIYTNDFTAVIQRLGNPYLRWERTGTLNLGLDYSVFKGKLYGSVEYYDKVGRDLLTNASIASVNGSTFANFNNATLRNNGIEVVLGTVQPIKGNQIVWKGSLNAAYNKAKVIKTLNTAYAPQGMIGGFNYITDYDPNTAWAYEYVGLVNGIASVKGADGATYPITNIPSTVDGRTFLKNVGTVNQPYILGMMNAFKIYDFDLSFIVTAKYGGVFKAQAFNFPGSNGNVLPNAQLTKVLNADANQVLTFPTVTTASLSPLAQISPALSYNYHNAGLLRMQEINLSYNLPATLLSPVKIRRAQLGLQGNNLFNIYANSIGEDPEFIRGNIKPTAQYTLNLRVEF